MKVKDVNMFKEWLKWMKEKHPESFKSIQLNKTNALPTTKPFHRLQD